MGTNPIRKEYNPPMVRQLSKSEVEKSLERAAKAGSREAAKMLAAIWRMRKTG